MHESKLILKINTQSLIGYAYAFLFIMYLPTFVSRAISIPYWGAFCYFVIAASDLYFIFVKKSVDKPTIFATLLFGYFTVVTVFMNFGELFNCLVRLFTAVSMSYLLEYIFHKYDRERIILIFMQVMEVFHYINFISMLIYPNGMYRVVTNGIYEELVKVEAGSVRTASRVLWLLGHQTLLIRFTLPAVCIALLYCYIGTGKFKLRTRSVLLILICIAETIIANSAGNYLVLLIFVLLLVLFKFRNRIKVAYVYPLILIFYVYFTTSSGELPLFTWMTKALQRSVQLSSRVSIWLNTIQSWLESPIFGLGYINDGAESIRKVLGLGNPHSSYLWVLYEGGVVGILGFVAYIQVHARKINRLWGNPIARIIYAAFLSLLFCMIDDDHVFRSQFYLIIFMLTYYMPRLANNTEEK